MRAIAIAFLPVAFAGCSVLESPNIAKCEAAIKARLKSPSSYKRVSASSIAGIQIDVEYDAVNSFNAPLRGKAGCSIDKNGAMTLYPDLST